MTAARVASAITRDLDEAFVAEALEQEEDGVWSGAQQCTAASV